MDNNLPKVVYSDSSVNISELLDRNCIIVCDSNVFLGLYRFSPDYANFALSCLNKVKQHIILPYTVKIEFERHFRSHYRTRQETIENSVKDAYDLVAHQREKMRNCTSALITRHFPDADLLQNEIDNKFIELEDIIRNYFSDRSVLTLVKDTWSQDVVSDLFHNLITNGQLAKDFTRDEIYRICEEGENRYKKSTPPGFKDKNQKDGIRKYSDLILWKEIIKISKEKKSSVIFVTDDIKPDWWYINDGRYEFLQLLVQEFERDTNKGAARDQEYKIKIYPFVSSDFYESISKSMDVERPDILDQALSITCDNYIQKIESRVFDDIVDTLIYSGFDYVDQSSLSYYGSSGVDEWEIVENKLTEYRLVERSGNQFIYELVYDISMEGQSYDYWGRDDDTKEIIMSPAHRHLLSGKLTVNVTRTVNMLTDFECSSDFDSTEIISGDFIETGYKAWDEDEDVPNAYDTCPDCGCKINFDNDALNGFCIKCAPNH